MNVIPRQTQVAIAKDLLVGMGVNATARKNGVNKKTVLRLVRRLGFRALTFHDLFMVNLPSRTIAIDEISGFVGKGKGQTVEGDNLHEVGEIHTQIALDRDSRLIIEFQVA